MQLSPHFSLAEMTASETADRFDLPNHPDDTAQGYLISLCEEILEPLRKAVGPITINSAFRSIPVNRKVGSKDTSHHTQGRAADIKVKGMNALDVCQTIVRLNLPFEQCIAEFATETSGWCHVSIPLDGQPPKRQTLSIDKQGTRSGLHWARK